jgi:hypothetical protein
MSSGTCSLHTTTSRCLQSRRTGPCTQRWLPREYRPDPRKHDTDPSSGALCCIGGPALIYYVSPTEEELFLKYNPELQKRSLENRAAKQQDFDDFVGRLKKYSKSDKPSMVAESED